MQSREGDRKNSRGSSRTQKKSDSSIRSKRQPEESINYPQYMDDLVQVFVQPDIQRVRKLQGDSHNFLLDRGDSPLVRYHRGTKMTGNPYYHPITISAEPSIRNNNFGQIEPRVVSLQLEPELARCNTATRS